MKVAETKISPQWSTAIPKEVRPFLKADKGDTIEWHTYQVSELEPNKWKVEIRKREKT